jgi:voltage-gated potassium channel Kch
MSTIKPEYIKNLDIHGILGEVKEAEIDKNLPMRQWLYAWLLDPHIPGNYQKFIDKWISILIIGNLFSLVFEHVPAIFEPNKSWFEFFDVFSVAVFTIEYALRLFLAPEDEEFKHKKFARLSFISSPFAIIDLLAILPFYLKSFIPIDLRVLRFLRLLRILKLFRVIIPAIHEFKELNKTRTFRQKIHALVYPSGYGGTMFTIVEVFIAIWVMLSVFAVILESVHSIDYVLNLQFVVLDAVAVAIFTVEYCLRIYSCVEEPGFKGAISGRFKQASTPSTVIDLLAILPFFLEVFLHHLFDLRFLRVFRLSRLLKLTRGNDATAILFKVVSREWPVMSASAFIMLLLVVLTASLGYLFEHDAQPDKFENIPTSIYWAVITLASVGYGDISPVTPIGRTLTIILALLGIGIFAIPAALLSSAFSDELIKERESLKANLFSMLKNGQVSDENANIIRAEAKRLHLSHEEINALIDQVIKEHDTEANSPLPIHKIGERAEVAIEHYKQLLSQIRLLGLHTNINEFEQAALQQQRLSEHELQVWRSIQKTT